MDTRSLIDSIVRQTTVLLAQLSTAAGVRSPLSHVADQVFYDLAREIEAQGVRQKVVADMFGLALRTYQKKMRRLTASTSERNRTLWEVVVSHIGEQGSVTREGLRARFRREDPADLAAVMKDLVASGIVYRTGRGASAVFGLTSPEDRRAMDAQVVGHGESDFVWLAIFRGGPATLADLCAQLPYEEASLRRALAELLADGRVEREPDSDRYRAGVFYVPVGAEQGWEAAVFDHYQAVAHAIAAKVNAGQLGTRAGEQVGGATLVFDVCDGHPLEDEVRGLLARMRAEIGALWHRVEAHNAQHPIARERLRRMSFYFGQAPMPDLDPLTADDEASSDGAFEDGGDRDA